MTDTEVLIAGAGPTGLMLACELRLAGVEVEVVDRLPERSGESRAGGLHARTMEVLDQRGVLERFRARGRHSPLGHFSGLWLQFDKLASEYPEPLVILQSTTEQLLEEWAAELGVRVRWSAGVTAVRQDADGVEADLHAPDGTRSDPATLRARYLVGCDGGRSAVRRLAGIDFPGTPPTLTAMIGDVELADPPSESLVGQRRPLGDFTVFNFEPGWYRVLTTEYDRVTDRSEPVTLEALRETLTRIAGTDFGMRNPRWLSRFADAARLAERYRRGRVLLAGDAAHVHYPAGGQGLNMGVQDAVNLGWKLAAVVRGRMPEEFLDTYHDERHPVAARVLHNTRAQAALGRPGPATDALREVFGTLIGFGEVNQYLSTMITALDLRYPTPDDHPLAGRRVPNADLKDQDGDTRIRSLLHRGRPVLLELRGAQGLDGTAAAWADRVDHVAADCADETWEVPAVGPVPVPAALLLRPDGHIAWVASAGTVPDTDALRTALTEWFGPPATAAPARG
ncbi:FAD-dependent monooxygenase [Streptomyces sp. NPDC001480]|uniref:FAD-dependent monooxygenase n=1 Tax=Streptomyces sp. NPDC001480 TaxID=3364577 RepID=UPI0036BAC8DE